MVPRSGCSNPSRSFTRVDFPQPLLPTTATYSPGEMSRLRLSRIAGSSFSYRNVTCFSSLLPFSPKTGFPSLEDSGTASRIGFPVSRIGFSLEMLLLWFATWSIQDSATPNAEVNAASWATDREYFQERANAHKSPRRRTVVISSLLTQSGKRTANVAPVFLEYVRSHFA